MELTKEQRAAECETWIQYLTEKGASLSPERFQVISVHIREIEDGKKNEKMDKDEFQKEVDEEEEDKKAKAAAASQDEPKKRMLPKRKFGNIVDLMDYASRMRFTPPSGFSGLEPGKGNMAGMIMPGTEPLQNPAASMWQDVGNGEIGDGPEAHSADQGAEGGNNISLAVWPEGFAEILVGGSLKGTAGIDGMVNGGRSIADGPEKTRTLEDGSEVEVRPITFRVDENTIRALIELGNQGLSYRRSLEMDGIRYVMTRDQEKADPDLHLRVMRSISDIGDLKAYVNTLRSDVEHKFASAPITDKNLDDFSRVKLRQTIQSAPGIGQRELVQRGQSTDYNPTKDARLFKG